jgi:hypothetical protein
MAPQVALGPPPGARSNPYSHSVSATVQSQGVAASGGGE